MSRLLYKGIMIGSRQMRLSCQLPAAYFLRNASSSAVKQQLAEASAEDIASIKNGTYKSVSEMPGPRSLPFFGGLFSMILDKDFKRNKLDQYWRKLKNKYGPIVKLDLPGSDPMIFLYKPEDCEKLTRVTMNNPIRMGNMSLLKIREETVNNYFGDKYGILISNGEEWKRIRSRVQVPMMKKKNVTAYMKAMDQVALDFMDRISDFQKTYGEMPSDFQTELYKWALESVGLVTLNRRLGCLDPSLSKDSEPMTLINEANNIFEAMNETEFGPPLWKFYPTAAFKQLRKSHTEFLRIADANIIETEARLLEKKSKAGSEEEEELTLMERLLLTPGLSRKDVVTLILDMLLAGIDTTSHTIGFTLYLLAKNPKCQSKLHEEIDRVIGDHDGPLTSIHLDQMSYMKAVVKESLRVFPLVLGTLRNIETDTVFSGYLVPKGYAVFTCHMIMSGDEDIFERASEFIPERWSRDKPIGNIHPHASQPFGIGTRMCVGRRIAEQEIYLFLVRAMQRYRVDYKYGDMTSVSRTVFVPSEPLRFEFTERTAKSC